MVWGGGGGLSWRVLSGGFCLGVFCLGGFVRDSFVMVCITISNKLKIYTTYCKDRVKH